MGDVTVKAAERLGAFVAGATVPPPLMELARTRLLDTLGAVLAGGDSPHAVTARERTATRLADGPSSVWLTARSAPPEEAAFVNSMLAHAVLLEDVGLGGHPSCNVVPAALACAALVEANGPELLEAVAIGYEVQMRMAADYGVFRSVGDRGLRGTTVTGAFGAAAAASRVLHLTAEEAAHAIGFAAALCSPGTEQPILEGSSERLLHMGSNTRAGVTAALLARDGFRAAQGSIDGPCGFFAAYSGSEMPPSVVADLNEKWISTDGLFAKSHPTAGMNFGPVYCVEQMLADGTLRPEDSDRIDEIHVLQKWWRVNTAYTSSGPFDTIEQALLSGPLAVATTLVHGALTLATLTLAMDDARTLALAQKVRLDGVATWSIVQGQVTVRLNDGSTIRRSADDMPRDLYEPSWDGCVAKLKMTCPDSAQLDRLVNAVNTLQVTESTADLVGTLRAG